MLSSTLLVSASALLASLLSTPVAAQLHTDCNPMEKDCPANPALGTNVNFNFNSTPVAGVWNATAGKVEYDAARGAAFTVAKQKDSPTIKTNFYFFWGRSEVWLKAATGTGIISSIVWMSDLLDEVDWEFFGGNATHASTNYFGKGRQDFRNAGYHPVNGGVQADYHNYTNVWTKDKLEWYIDGQLIRTLVPAAANNTQNYPQTPMQLSLGIWAGGDPDMPKGTIEWAGGQTDYTKGPYTMFIKSAQVTDFTTGKEYSYGDRTGSWQSIKVVAGNSTAKETIEKGPDPTISDKWAALSPTAKTAIFASVGAAVAIGIAAIVIYCIKQRRRGRREAALAMQRLRTEHDENEAFKKSGRNPDELAYDGVEYSAANMRKDGLVRGDSYNVPESPTGMGGLPEKPWDNTNTGYMGAGAAAAAGGAMPLLRDGQHSPYAGVSPGMPPPRVQSPAAGNRSFSSPNAQMRMGSPGPQNAGYSVPRMQSPGAVPPPNRSFTDPRGPQGGPQGYGNGGGYNPQDGYWR